MTVNTNLRDYIDEIAPPVTIDEIRTTSRSVHRELEVPPSNTRGHGSRWAAVIGGAIAVAAASFLLLSTTLFDADEAIVSTREPDGGQTIGRVVESWKRLADPNSAFIPYGMRATGEIDQVADGDGGRMTVEAVTKTNKGWIAVGHERIGFAVVAAVWSSPDGSLWERIAANSAALGDPSLEPANISPTGFQMADVASRDDVVIAVGQENRQTTNPAGWRSFAGGDWQRFDFENQTPNSVTMVAVTTTELGFTAIGVESRDLDDGSENDVKVWISENGLNWSPVSGGFDPGDSVESVETVGNRIIAVGSIGGFVQPTAAAWTSEDGGQSWAKSELPPAVADRSVTQVVDVAAGPSGLVAVGLQAINGDTSSVRNGDGLRSLGDQQDIVLWSSPDGATWQQSSELREPNRITIDPSIVWGPAGYMVTFSSITETGIAASSWLTPDGSQPVSIAHARDRMFMSVGATDDRYIAFANTVVEYDGPDEIGGSVAPPIELWELATE